VKDEPIDVLDENGDPTGEVLMKSEVHSRSLWHPVVHLWIYNSDKKFLLQKRAPQKLVWPNKWDVSVAGHMAAGETSEQALIKEAKEELNLDIKIEQANLFERLKAEEPMDGWINRIFIYLYTMPADINIGDLSLEADEVSEVRWFDAGSARNLDIAPGVKVYLPKLLKKFSSI
jgi:isopentenyl-diphosphate delta-isomerase